MAKEFDHSQKRTVPHDAGFGETGYRTVCPDCKDHKQLSTRELNDLLREGFECDCKNVFTRRIEGATRTLRVSQCCCFSEVHKG